MIINVISDLHCRGKKLPQSFKISDLVPADVLVIAGDLGTGINFNKIKSKIETESSGKFKHVIVIKGNHDYYITDYGYIDKHGIPEGPSCDDNFVRTIGEVDFICTPLWSPIKNHNKIRYSLNDYNYIPKFTTEACTELFWKNLSWLEEKVSESREKGQKIVIVTHHLPLEDLIDPNYRESDINEAFCVMDGEAQERIRKIRPDLWIHGHSHNFMDATLDDIRYVRNPYGYEWSSHDYGSESSKEKTGFRNDFVIEI